MVDYTTNFEAKVLKEEDGSYAIACSILGIYAVGKTLKEAKKDFLEALDLHLETICERAIKVLTCQAEKKL